MTLFEAVIFGNVTVNCEIKGKVGKKTRTEYIIPGQKLINFFQLGANRDFLV